MATKKPEVQEENAVVVPDYLKGLAPQTTDSEALAGLSSKIPRVSLKGRKFRLIVEGEEIIKPSDTLKVVILAVEPEKGRMVKTFYAKGYSSGDSEPPTCSSADGARPDAWIQDPQHSNCAQCPKNAFGSSTSQSGKPSKACRDSKRLWVAIPENEKNEDLGLGIDGTMFSLGVPVTSLGSLSDFGKQIAKNGYPLPAVIVNLEMVDSEFPQIEFKFDGFLPEKEGRIAIERNISKDWLDSVPAGPALENSVVDKKPSIADETSKAKANTDETKSGDVNSVVDAWT